MRIFSILMTLFVVVGILFVTASASAMMYSGEKMAWKPLFDGKTLEGWVQRNGKAKYEVVDGMIVGTTVKGTPNSFLCTEKDYGDFILELELWVNPTLNSGIQIRSESKPDYKNGRVHGYQVEIDPSSRAWSGGIYDEARRRWLFNLKDKPAAQKAFKQNDWNHYRIEAIGDRIRSWVNGVPAADLKDDMTLRGFIALQVHKNNNSGLEVKWRNLRIQDLDEGGSGKTLKALIVDGQNNHKWESTTPVLVRILEESGMFTAAVATSPAQGQPMDGFKPKFAKYDVIVLNYAGDNWPKVTQDAFLQYVFSGGGVVVFHAADNAFPKWKEFNEIIGLGGWGGRNETSGPYVYMKNGKVVRDTSPGRGGAHGRQNSFVVTTREPSHPIMKDLPVRWLHARDELYSKLRGPAKNMTILATAMQPTSEGGTGRDEPTLFTISYGKGRIFHTVLGHGPYAMSCVGFAVTLVRGAEWAATGKVTMTKVPQDFPTATEVSTRAELMKPKVSVNMDAIMQWEFSKDRNSMAAMEEFLRGASPSALRSVEAELINVLEAPQATYAGKQYVCRLLRKIGSEQCVPALAKLLTDTKLSHMARFALQYNTSTQATEALRNALDQVRDDNLKIGLVGSLGASGDRGAVSQIARYLTSSNAALTRAAIRSLGQIGGSEAAAILSKVRVRQNLKLLQADSLLLCADSLAAEGKVAKATEIYAGLASPRSPSMIRVAACRGMIQANPDKSATVISAMLKDTDRKVQQAAGKFMSELPAGENVTRAMAQMLSGMESDGQIMLLGALAQRGDRSVCDEVVRLVNSSNEMVSVEAIRTLGALGGADQVNLLAGLSTRNDETGRAAFGSLTRLTGTGVSGALNQIVRSNPNAAQRSRIIEVILARQETQSLPTLLEAAKDDNGDVRRAAIKALGELGAQTELSALVTMLVTSPSSSERSELQQALLRMVGRFGVLGYDSDTAGEPILAGLTRANDEAKVSIITVLPRLGGSKALAALRRELRGSSEVKKAAIRALAQWPDATPMADLLKAAQSEQDMANHVLALRGFIRLSSQSADKSAGEKRALFTSAMETARRTEEKKRILGALAKHAAPWSLEFAKKYQKDPALQAEATAAYNEIFAVINKMTVVGRQGVMKAKDAKVHGPGAAYEPASNRDCIGVWDNVKAWVSWEVVIQKAGEYEVIASQSMAGTPGSTYEVSLAGQKVQGKVQSTGDWARFGAIPLGKIKIAESGTYTLAVKPIKKVGSHVMNLRSVTLKRVN